jgi:hypothetical protein
MECVSLPLAPFTTMGYVPGGVGDEVAVPLRLTVWGLPLALSTRLTDPLREPAAVGVNATLSEQVLLAATEAPVQVSAVFEKSPALVPPMLTVEMASPALPLLVIVTDCAALVVPMACEAKVRLAGEMPTAGAAGGVCVPPPPPPPLPPHAAHTPTTRSVAANSKAAGRRRIAGVLRIKAKSNIPANKPSNPTGKR